MRSGHPVSAEMNEKKNARPTITAVAEHSDDENLRAEKMKDMEEDLTQIKASKSKTVCISYYITESFQVIGFIIVSDQTQS